MLHSLRELLLSRALRLSKPRRSRKLAPGTHRAARPCRRLRAESLEDRTLLSLTGDLNFTLVALPDTQHYTVSATRAPILESQIRWIVNNRFTRDIAFATGEGDITDNDTDAEFQRAVIAYQPLADSGMPYAVPPGNHDGSPNSAGRYLRYFGPSRYAGRTWFVGASANGQNTAQVFRADGQMFLHLALQKAPGAESFAFARSMAGNPLYRGLPTIVTTHDYLELDGTRSTAGNALWANFVNTTPQVFLVLAGHNHGEARLVSTNAAGLPVYQLLADYQHYANGGNGFLRRYEFSVPASDPAHGTLRALTYSPSLNTYETDANSQFQYTIDWRRFGGVTQENAAPQVNAGTDLTVSLPSPASLHGTVTDDGRPAFPGAVTTTWAKINGPGTVTFANAAALDTTARFSAAGTYVLRLTATDGALYGSDYVIVTAVAGTSSTVTATFQNGVLPASSYAGMVDTKIYASSPTTNGGSSATLMAVGGSGSQETLMKWDLRSIPAGSTIRSVTLSANVSNASSQPYELYALKRNWIENRATWNAASTGVNWEIPGAKGASDRGTTVLGAMSAATTGVQTFTLNAAGIAQVQAWVNNPASNCGFILQDPANSDAFAFDSSEAVTSATRPKLTVIYTTSTTTTNKAAGADPSVATRGAAALSGRVADDGLPVLSNKVTTTRTKITGPGTLPFAIAAAVVDSQFGQSLRMKTTDAVMAALTDEDLRPRTIKAAPLRSASSAARAPDGLHLDAPMRRQAAGHWRR